MAEGMRQDRDLVLPPGTYAYVLDETKGHVTVYVGPSKTSLSNTDQLVEWTGKRFLPVNDLEKAVKSFVKASESQYVVLTDPAESAEEFPAVGQTMSTVKLDAGKKIVIPGPTTFALWPGQTAEVIDGHQLSYNEYLVVRVYEPEAARENIERAIASPQKQEEGEAGDGATLTQREFTMGERMVIRGTEFSYYVPSTGIEVVPEVSESGRRSYVRSAATLEQLEYCVLIDENGRKRYERGPAVVFPEPTETFVVEKNNRKFRAIELNPQSGLYIKVIADYVEDGVAYTEGQELFLTGEETPIYFPREEHSVIQYGDQRKHYAVAIPTGEGRYVLDRTQGEVALVKGPSMFLPDPRKEVVVRRVLEADTVSVMYPGNQEAQQVNAQWRTELGEAESDFLVQNVASVASGQAGSLASSYRATSTFAGERMKRGTEYTPPRTITLDTKYQGAVAVSVWPGYAVLVMDRSGNRHVIEGPANILLEYDETLSVLSLSTGRPKNDTTLYKTVYLRTINNQVSDVVPVETADLVPVHLHLSYRVNFEGEGDDRLRWFDVENYVKTLTDHCRSRLRGALKRVGIQKLQAETADIVRDCLLGPAAEGGRTGLPFEENGMRLVDIEVLDTIIGDVSVAQLLQDAQNESLRGSIELTQAEQRAARQAQLEELTRGELTETELTADARAEAALAGLERLAADSARRYELDRVEAHAHTALAEIVRERTKADADQSLAITVASSEAELENLRGEVTEFVRKAGAVQPQFIAALQEFGDKQFVSQTLEALGPVATALGVTTVDLLHQMLKGTPFEGLMETLSERPAAARRALEHTET